MMMAMTIDFINSLVETCPRGAVSTVHPSDPCDACPLRSVCDTDECGMKEYEVDQSTPPYGSFEDWVAGWYD